MRHTEKSNEFSNISKCESLWTVCESLIVHCGLWTVSQHNEYGIKFRAAYLCNMKTILKVAPVSSSSHIARGPKTGQHGLIRLSEQLHSISPSEDINQRFPGLHSSHWWDVPGVQCVFANGLAEWLSGWVVECVCVCVFEHWPRHQLCGATVIVGKQEAWKWAPTAICETWRQTHTALFQGGTHSLA